MDFHNKGALLSRTLKGDVAEMVRGMISSISMSIGTQQNGIRVNDQHHTLNFQGAGVTVSDNPSFRRTDILISGATGSSSTTTIVSSTAAKALSLWNGTSNNAPPANWNQPGFSTSTWSAAVVAGTQNGNDYPTGTSPIWSTANPASNTERSLTVQSFTLPSLTLVGATLLVGNDDGFIGIWINGNFVTGSDTVNNANAGSWRTLNVPTSFLNQAGSNIIAVEGFNSAPTHAFIAYQLQVTGTQPSTQSGTAAAIATGGTISTSSGVTVARVSPTAAVTGVILQAGTFACQEVWVLNEAAAANTVTFAASGTSHVADGAAAAIAGLTGRKFVWDTVTSLWYRAA